MAARVSRGPRLAMIFRLTFRFSRTELTMRRYSYTMPLEERILTDRVNMPLSLQSVPDCQHDICVNVPQHGRFVG